MDRLPPPRRTDCSSESRLRPRRLRLPTSWRDSPPWSTPRRSPATSLHSRLARTFDVPAHRRDSFGNGLGTVPAVSETVVGGVYCCGFLDAADVLTPSIRGSPQRGSHGGWRDFLATPSPWTPWAMPTSVGKPPSRTSGLLRDTAGAESVLMRRRVNARGFPTNPTSQTQIGGAAPAAANTLFLADFPPQLDHSGNATVTPFGSIPEGALGAGATTERCPRRPSTLPPVRPASMDGSTRAFPATSRRTEPPISIFPNGTGSEPETSSPVLWPHPRHQHRVRGLYPVPERHHNRAPEPPGPADWDYLHPARRNHLHSGDWRVELHLHQSNR